MIVAAKTSSDQNRVRAEDIPLYRYRDRCRGFPNISSFWLAKIPVANPGVEWPKSGIFGPLSMLDRNTNLRSLGPFKLRIEEPDVLNFNAGLVEISPDQIDGRTLRKSGDTKLPVTGSRWWWDSFEATFLISNRLLLWTKKRLYLCMPDRDSGGF